MQAGHIGELHSVFELRECRRGVALGQHLSVHVIQLSELSPGEATGYDAHVERWARFFVGYDDPQMLAQLATEDPTMALATQTLEEISQDRRLALEREDARKLHHMDLVACREEGHEEGRNEGRATLLLEQLGTLFGPTSAETQARVRAGTTEDLRAWGQRVLGAKHLDEVFGR